MTHPCHCHTRWSLPIEEGDCRSPASPTAALTLTGATPGPQALELFTATETLPADLLRGSIYWQASHRLVCKKPPLGVGTFHTEHNLFSIKYYSQYRP